MTKHLIIMNTKHYIEGLLPAWKALACDTELSTLVCSRDLSWVEDRALAEGLRFLTVTLPSLGKAVERSFQSGRLELPEGFKSVRGEARPVFLRKAFTVLFNEDGTLKPRDINPVALYERDMYALAAKCIRQLTLLYYKYEAPYTDSQVSTVIESFVSTETEVAQMAGQLDALFKQTAIDTWETYFRARVLTRARLLVHYVLGNYNPLDIMPKHGSGASACGTVPWERYKLPRYIPRMGKVFDYVELFFTGSSLADQLEAFLDAEEFEPVAKVVLVPKDSRGPRLISEEPRETMYVQQGLMSLMYEAIDRRPGVRAMLSCVDQTRNRNLALYASESGEYSTLDLKDASDRVSIALVRGLFPRVWFEALMACRCEKTELPDGRVIDLNGKFAPMGSACCFPVEAICFWALSLAAVLVIDEETAYDQSDTLFLRDETSLDLGACVRPGDQRLDKPSIDAFFISRRRLPSGVVRRSWVPAGLNATDRSSWVGKPLRDLLNWDKYETRVPVSVFGDDIIVPTHAAKAVVGILEDVGLKVNVDKSFTCGPFRESCGGDYLLGRDVSIVRLKKQIFADPNPIKLIKRKHDVVWSMFRTRDFAQNALSMYGDTNTLYYSLRNWFYDLYAEELPGVCSATRAHDEGTVANGLFLRSVWGKRAYEDIGVRCPCGDILSPAYSDPFTKWRSAPKWECSCGRTSILYGFPKTDRRNGYNHPAVYVRKECPVDIKIDNSDWCHVLRSLGNQGGLRGTSHVTMANRNRYNIGWVRV